VSPISSFSDHPDTQKRRQWNPPRPPPRVLYSLLCSNNPHLACTYEASVHTHVAGRADEYRYQGILACLEAGGAIIGRVEASRHPVLRRVGHVEHLFSHTEEEAPTGEDWKVRRLVEETDVHGASACRFPALLHLSCDVAGPPTPTPRPAVALSPTNHCLHIAHINSHHDNLPCLCIL
jgi:hypothetical protein